MTLVRLCRRHQHAVFLLTALLVVAGLVSLFQLPSNIYPELNFPRVVVLVHSGDLSPENTMIAVTRPLEESVATVLGVRRVRSRTIRGGAEISVLFSPETDMQTALQYVQARVAETRATLPAGTEVQVERLTPTVWPVFSMVLNGRVPGSDLRDYAFYNLRPLFSRVPGVARVQVEASEIREISVIVDPEKVLSHRLSLPEVAERLRATNQVESVGRLEKDYRQFLVLSSGQFGDLEQIRNTVISAGAQGQPPLRLRDIAEVREGVADRLTLVTGNGEPAALISITRQIGGNILQVVRDVRSLMENAHAVIPATLRLSVVYDLAEFVSNAMADVRNAILVGSLLAVLILFLFLREMRTTFIAATTLPLAAVGTFAAMRLHGGTLNLMSLGGLAIAIGLVIDDAVVVVENIYRHLGRGDSPDLAAELGTGELIGPVLGSTVTTVVVFLPLGLLKGVVGEFFSALSLTLASAVLLSLLLALTLIPLLSQRLLLAGSHRESAERFMEPVNRRYERAVRWALGHRAAVGLTAAVSLLLTVFLFLHVETGFLPEMDEGGYVLDYLTAPGTSLSETDRLVRRIEERIRAMPETAAFSRRTGAELGLFATEQNKGDILVKLKPRSERHRDIQEVAVDLRRQVERDVPGINVEFIQILQDMIGDLEGSPEPVEVKLFGPSTAELEKLAAALAPRIEAIPGIVDFKSVQRGNPEFVFHVDPVRAGRLGMSVEQVSAQLSAGLLGATVTELRQGDRTIPIRVRYPDGFRYNPAQVPQFPVVSPGGQIVPLSALAEVEQVSGSSQLLRENQRPMVVLTARLEERDLGSAIRDVKRQLEATRFPVGYTYEIGGQYESQQNSFRELVFILLLALAAVLTVLVIQFRSFRPALIILSAAPLSLLGVVVMLMLTGTPLNVSSFMGIILLVGLVVKNGIILFEYQQRLRESEGLDLAEALVRAGKVRVRPILMTTLCTLFGLLPLALGLGSGAELQKPLAIAVIGGLSLSTFVTLLVMPVLYSLLEAPRVD